MSSPLLATASMEGSYSGTPDRSTSNEKDGSKEAERQERIKAKNRRAQRKYREKKLMEVDTYKQQIKELNARMRAMAEEKRALEKDKSRLERMVQAEAVQAQPATVQPCPPLVQPLRTVTDMLNAHPYLKAPPEAQVQHYRESVHGLRILLAAGADDPGSAFHSELLEAMHRLREVQHILVMMFPYRVARLKADIQQQACQEAGPHTPALWQSVVAAAKFTPQQRQKLIMLRAELLRQVDEVVAERRRLTNDIKAMLPHPSSSSAFGNMLYKAQLSTSKLRQNVEQEYQLVTNFILGTVYETLTPVQHARCIVAAAPYLPDILYICSQLYVEEHRLPPDHLDLLPDMDAILSDMSSYGWMSGLEQGDATAGSLWPTVYQGLDVYQEPLRPPSAGTPIPTASTALPDAVTTGGDHFAEQGLPTDALAALLAADSLPAPDELHPWLTVEQPLAPVAPPVLARLQAGGNQFQ